MPLTHQQENGNYRDRGANATSVPGVQIMSETARISRRFRVRLRTIFVAVALVAAVAAWLANTLAFVQSRNELLAKFDSSTSLLACGLLPPDPTPNISWLRRALGDVPCTSLMYDPRRDPDGSELRRAREFFPEARIRIWSELANDNPPAGVEIATDQAVGDPSQEINDIIDLAQARR